MSRPYFSVKHEVREMPVIIRPIPVPIPGELDDGKGGEKSK